jgi:hypothetical protein
MDDAIFANICAVCAIMTGLPATLVLLTTLVPDYIKRARVVVRQRPGQSFLLGLINFLFVPALFALPCALGLRDAVTALVVTLTIIALLPFMLMGAAIVIGVVGEQLLSQTVSRPGSLLGSLVAGIVMFALTALVPVVGWVLLLGLVMAGMGAAMIVFVRQTRKPSQAVDEALE